MDASHPIGLPGLDPTHQPDFVTALARGLSVIRAFGVDTPRLSLTEIARVVKLPRATVRRSLITLATLGYVEGDGLTYSLTPKVLSLGGAYLSSSPLARRAQPLLKRFVESTHESCRAAILDEDEVLVVASATVEGHMPDRSVGSRMPAFCSSLGRMLLAGRSDLEIDRYFDAVVPRHYTPSTVTAREPIQQAIQEARHIGYAVTEGEFRLGIRAIAVPVIDRKGRTVAALNAAGPMRDMSTADMIDRFLPMLRRTADEFRSCLS